MRYRLFGLTVESELQLPLLPGERDHFVDVEITLGQVIPGPELIWQQDDPLQFSCTRNLDEIILCWPTMRFAVTRDRVVVDAGDLDLAAISLFQGSLAVLLTARGNEAFHASVVARDDHAVAIAGASGSGKSSAALALLDKGWSLLSDDILTFDKKGNAVAGAPFIRLRSDRAADRLGTWDVVGKLRYTPALCSASQPLAAIIVHGDEFHECRRLTGVMAIGALLKNIYNDVITHAGQAERRLALALKLANDVPIYGIPPRSLMADQIEAIVSDAIGATSHVAIRPA
jgi:hypothetical protein